ncbi:DUF4397 domain-containing protein [Paenibacillus beijingensis]|uniref:DUF4397 domain-containing protein n=1 Tax=Paenibacillus beijingensis TaxID=1126833 RepID=A0A0D5NIW3_9BACL|nr:DUF4397 domain-containing protein [Paenibacillus beijingensis]AJY74932.1 hypothetical protein VN24_10455 [Paenibacillus beijingensis]
MTPHDFTIMEWKKASLYGLLAQLYQSSNRDLHEHYNGLYIASVRKLADAVHAYGDPFSDRGSLVPAHGDPYMQAGFFPGFAHAAPLSGYNDPPYYPLQPGSFLPPNGPLAYPGGSYEPRPDTAVQAGMDAHPASGALNDPAPGAYGFPDSGAYRDPPFGASSFPAPGTAGTVSGTSAAYPFPPPYYPDGNQILKSFQAERPPAQFAAVPDAYAAMPGHGYGLLAGNAPPPGNEPLPLHAPVTKEPSARVRVLNACPGAPAFDVHAAGSQIAASLAYKSITDYIDVRPGACTFHWAEARRKLVRLTETVDLESGVSYTAAAAGGSPDEMRLCLFRDERSVADGCAKTRFIHLAPQEGGTDVMFRDGGTLYRNIEFAEASSYVTLAPLCADLQIMPTGSPRPLLESAAIEFAPGTVTTAIAVGIKGGNPPLETILLHDERGG